jgi:TadE-like protein
MNNVDVPETLQPSQTVQPTFKVGVRNVSGRRRSRETASTTVEALIIVPIVFLMIFAAFQTAVIWHGKTVLHAGAARALRAERTRAAGVETETANEALLAVVSRDAAFIANPTAWVTTNGQLLVVTVTGSVSGPFPGLTMGLSERVTAFDERFRPLCIGTCP